MISNCKMFVCKFKDISVDTNWNTQFLLVLFFLISLGLCLVELKTFHPYGKWKNNSGFYEYTIERMIIPAAFELQKHASPWGQYTLAAMGKWLEWALYEFTASDTCSWFHCSFFLEYFVIATNCAITWPIS